MTLDIRAENAPLKPGDEFLKYEIRSLLGHGDHAYVYEAFDAMLQRVVAIKIIPDPPNSRRDLVQRSLEQGPILRDLNHPNLVSVYDVGTVGDDLVYIVMERLVGRSLRELLADRHILPLAEVLSIGIQVAEGMAWAHALQVIHRDLKPENIFITDPPGIKVINAGVTSFIVPSGMTTEWDCVRGTLLYMSPEHLQGFGVTALTDIFSLGALLFECLAGCPPALVGAEPTSLDDIAWRQISEMPPLLSTVLPEVPELAARAIQQMLAKEAALRFESMDAVAVSLREVYRRLVPDVIEKPDEQRPLVMFPSTAIGMRSAPPREEAASEASVVAGAERLVSSNEAEAAGTVIAAARAGYNDTRGATRGLGRHYVIALFVALAGLAGWLTLRSRLSVPNDNEGNPTASARAIESSASPQQPSPGAAQIAEPVAASAATAAPTTVGASGGGVEALPSGTKNIINSKESQGDAPETPPSTVPPSPAVLKRAARPRAPHPSGSAQPGELVF